MARAQKTEEERLESLRNEQKKYLEKIHALKDKKKECNLKIAAIEQRQKERELETKAALGDIAGEMGLGEVLQGLTAREKATLAKAGSTSEMLQGLAGILEKKGKK